jgi:hypothetical protein
MQDTPLQVTFDSVVMKIGYKSSGGMGLEVNEHEKE